MQKLNALKNALLDKIKDLKSAPPEEEFSNDPDFNSPATQAAELINSEEEQL